MAGWLPEAEGAQQRFEFNSEMAPESGIVLRDANQEFDRAADTIPAEQPTAKSDAKSMRSRSRRDNT
jgi:hypothetical protein